MRKTTQGGKELGLLKLQEYSKQYGYTVPEFSVIPETDYAEDLVKIADHFSGKNVIVRSNTIMENTEFGFDGIYKTIVVEKCNLEKLRAAHQEVSDSLFSENAIAYRNQAGITHDSMRVIVQKFISGNGVEYFVMETSINAQGDISITSDAQHDFVNKNSNRYEEMILGKNGDTLMVADKMIHLGLTGVLIRLQKLAVDLEEVFGPVSIEGAFIRGGTLDEMEIFLFQRRLLPKEVYHAQPEVVPAKYTDTDILFRSRSYRGAGKLENLPIVVMPGIETVSIWEDELRKRTSQFTSDVILFVSSMALGELSVRILKDYSVLSKVKAIISMEGIDYSSHAFKVASLARIPFVSIESFKYVERVSCGSLFFTENEAVFCIDKKRDEFNFNHIKKSTATSLATLLNRKGLVAAFFGKAEGVVVEFSESKRTFGFNLNLDKFSFHNLEVALHRLLEDITDEVWLMGKDNINRIGFKFENVQGHVIEFSGWRQFNNAHVRLDNFSKDFEGNQIEWELIQKIATELGALNKVT